ncbi:MAG: hypothetical protein Q4F56_01200 [Candidatus Saccharibacteria bacterium]|nr:hypothetical protein [Candidatus Saccharibacteria bacterium]
MKQIKYGVVAGITMLSFSLSSIVPTFAEPCDDPEGNCQTSGGDVVLVGDPDELNSVALSSVSVQSNISVAIGEQVFLPVTYNEGFEVANIDQTQTLIDQQTGEEYFAYTGFDGRWDESTHEFIQDSTTFYVYGNRVGSGTFTLRATDVNGNQASTQFTVTVRDALGSAYDAITYTSDEGWMQARYEAGAEFGTPIEHGSGIKLTEVPLTADLQALDENLKAVLDIVVIDKDGAIIPVDGNSIRMWFGINKEMLTEDYQYFQIAYIKDGKIKEYIDVENIEDDGWGYIFDFATTHCSAYAILASNTEFPSAAERNALIPADDAPASPDTGALAESSEGGATTDHALAVAMVALSTMAVTYGVLRFSKREE